MALCLQRFWPAYDETDGFTSVAQWHASWSSNSHAGHSRAVTLSMLLKMASERPIAGHRGARVHSCLQWEGRNRDAALNWANVTFSRARRGTKRLWGNFGFKLRHICSRSCLSGLCRGIHNHSGQQTCDARPPKEKWLICFILSSRYYILTWPYTLFYLQRLVVCYQRST